MHAYEAQHTHKNQVLGEEHSANGESCTCRKAASLLLMTLAVLACLLPTEHPAAYGRALPASQASVSPTPRLSFAYCTCEF